MYMKKLFFNPVLQGHSAIHCMYNSESINLIHVSIFL